MNIELAFIKGNETDKIVNIVNERINGYLKCTYSDSCQIEVPDSYESILANDKKRKVAISTYDKDWIAVIESKEVNDYAMLLHISNVLKTEVVAIIQSDVIGAWGYVEIYQGKIVNSYFSEEDDEIEELIDGKLEEKKITIPIYMFREVVREKENGWDIVQINN